MIRAVFMQMTSMVWILEHGCFEITPSYNNEATWDELITNSTLEVGTPHIFLLGSKQVHTSGTLFICPTQNHPSQQQPSFCICLFHSVTCVCLDMMVYYGTQSYRISKFISICVSRPGLDIQQPLKHEHMQIRTQVHAVQS